MQASRTARPYQSANKPNFAPHDSRAEEFSTGYLPVDYSSTNDSVQSTRYQRRAIILTRICLRRSAKRWKIVAHCDAWRHRNGNWYAYRVSRDIGTGFSKRYAYHFMRIGYIFFCWQIRVTCIRLAYDIYMIRYFYHKMEITRCIFCVLLFQLCILKCRFDVN